jgi:hypothetical protein
MPVNFGITVDFEAGTVEGFSITGKISSSSTSTKIAFNGEYRGDTIQSGIAGSIDRVTGSLFAAMHQTIDSTYSASWDYRLTQHGVNSDARYGQRRRKSYA